MNIRFRKTATTLAAAALVIFAALPSAGASARHPAKTDGYPIANFAVTVNASQTGAMFGRILQNSGKLGGWLRDRGAVTLSIRKEAHTFSLDRFRDKDIGRAFPFITNTYRDTNLMHSNLAITAFSPLGINDINSSSLPVVLVEVTLTNPTTEPEALELVLTPDSLFKDGGEAFKNTAYSGVGNTHYQLSANTETRWEKRSLHIPVNLKAAGSKTVKLILTFFDEDWISANQFAGPDQITAYAYRHWNKLERKTWGFERAIPRTGDTELDTYLRWYMVPGVALTRCTKNGEILTMGYAELNQRDSYWTSFMHLVLFKDAEKKMIEESIAHQQPSGKIPTTILPLIERHDDLDINAFFILRIARFYKYYKNKEDLKNYWPALKLAMDWLISRDTGGTGLPAQVSFWGDWKDVKGVQGRKYSPFSGLIYLAALKQMEYLSREAGDMAGLEKYRQYYQKGHAFINKDVADGGLWNGQYYCQIWNDGTVNEHLLQDQTIGILFGVVPEERAAKIFDSLNQMSLTEYGIAETFPYYPAEWGYEPATYHNGAVWPWLSFMDCWARLQTGRKKDALWLVKTVAQADLVNSGDWSPNEHINSTTGENLGFQLQGWNTALYGLVYFGLLQPDAQIL